MKHFLLSVALVGCVVLPAQADLTEDFNSAKGSWTTEIQVTLPSGKWTFGGGAQANTSNGIAAIKFNANGAYMISPAVDSVKSLSFSYRSGGSNKRIAIAYQIGVGDWQAVDTLLIMSSTSAMSSYSKTIGLDSAKQVRIRLIGLQNNSYVDDFKMVQAQAGGNTGGGGGTVVPADPEPDFTRPTFVPPATPIIYRPQATMRRAMARLKNRGIISARQ